MQAKLHALSPELESFASEPYYQVIGKELELFSAAARKKLPVLLKGPTGCGKTRFVEYMAWKLGRPLPGEPAKRRLLVSLSDGRPDDFGDDYRSRYGIEYTRQALLEARQAGVRSFCVTLDKGGADYLKYMYGAAAFAVLDDVRKLPLKIADIYRKLTI